MVYTLCIVTFKSVPRSTQYLHLTVQEIYKMLIWKKNAKCFTNLSVILVSSHADLPGIPPILAYVLLKYALF